MIVEEYDKKGMEFKTSTQEVSINERLEHKNGINNTGGSESNIKKDYINIEAHRNSGSELSDPDDDIPLKIVKSSYNKKKKKVQQNKQRLCNKIKTVDQTVRQYRKKKPVNEDGLTEDEVAMLKDFIVMKLSMNDQIAEIDKRKESLNYKESPFKCDICYRGFLQAATLKNHMIRHDTCSGDIECSICKFRFNSNRKYTLHAVRHTKKYVCKTCNFVTLQMDQAKKHKQWHEGVTYRCQYCDEISYKLTSHLSHMRIKHPSEFLCDVCGYSFVSLKGVKMHKSRMHKDMEEKEKKLKESEVEESSLYCKECEIQFMSNVAWKRHMVTSVKHKSCLVNGCRHCGETFPTAGQLRRHSRSHAARPARTARPARPARPRRLARYPTSCEHCDEIIANRSLHWKHYQRCHQDKEYPFSERNYICEMCGKGFQSNASLTNHKRTHFEERLYKCRECHKAFYNKNNLHIHLKTHSDHRPHACSVCYKTFKTKLGLLQHFKRHTGMRPFCCQYCGKAFSRSACRNIHIKHVHR